MMNEHDGMKSLNFVWNPYHFILLRESMQNDPDEPQNKLWNIPLWFEISSQVTDEAADEQTIKKLSPITSKVYDLVVKLT